MSYQLDTSLKSQQVLLNSGNASLYKNGSFNSDVVFILQNTINVQDNVSILCSLVSANVPLSMYIINSNNNFLKIGTTSITITNGNYTASTFISYMNNLSNNYTWSFNSTTNKFTISTVSTNFSISSTSTCLDVIGFAGGETSSSYSLTSTYVCNFAGTLYLTVETQLTTHNIDSYNKVFSNVLATIPINEASGGITLYENKNNFKTYLSEKLINYLEIKIYDSTKNLINFNGKNWFILLQFDFISSLSVPDKPLTLADVPTGDYDPDNPIDLNSNQLPTGINFSGYENEPTPSEYNPNEPISNSKFADFSNFDDDTTNNNFIKKSNID
jgi:hypothetical protein